MKRVLLCLLTACAITPRELPAQQPREQLQRAQTHSWYLRALQGDSIIATGRVRAVTDEAVRIETTEVAYMELTTIERRKRVSGGWWRGAATGTVFMSLLFAGLAGSNDSGLEGLELIAGSVLSGALVGVPLGGLIGGVLVPGKHEWETIWRAGL